MMKTPERNIAVVAAIDVIIFPEFHYIGAISKREQ